MPIIPLKDNPPSKSFEGSILEKDGTWHIAKVKPRQEKAFAFDLLYQGIDYYLPYYEKKTKRSDGKFRKSILVLFPSYVPFICNDPHILHTLLKQNRIVTLLPVNGQERLKKELQNIFSANTAGVEMESVEPGAFKPGDTVEILAGPFKGVTGNVIVAKESAFVTLSINSMGYIKVRVDTKSIRFI